MFHHSYVELNTICISSYDVFGLELHEDSLKNLCTFDFTITVSKTFISERKKWGGMCRRHTKWKFFLPQEVIKIAFLSKFCIFNINGISYSKCLSPNRAHAMHFISCLVYTYIIEKDNDWRPLFYRVQSIKKSAFVKWKYLKRHPLLGQS